MGVEGLGFRADGFQPFSRVLDESIWSTMVCVEP